MRRAIIIKLLLFTSIVIAQQVDKKEILVNELFQITKMKESCEMVINQLINKVKENHKNKSSINWQTIKSKIDYSSFIAESKKVYTSNYTENELKELLSLYKSNKDVEYQNKKNRNSIVSIG